MKTDFQARTDFSGFFKEFLEREYGTYIWRPRNAKKNAEGITFNKPNPDTSVSVCPSLPILHKEF